MVVAGDPSGDEHASHVLRELRLLDPEITVFGIGGPAMVRHGLEQSLPFEPFNRMGFAEVLSSLPFFISARKRLVREMMHRRPSALLLVDYPGLNIHLLKDARRAGIPAVWYIAPKVWAWKKKRIRILGTNATVIATIFPFEPSLYEGYPARVHYAGNPLMEALNRTEKTKTCTRSRKKPPVRPWRIALVPGSRIQEVGTILPSMLEAVSHIRRKMAPQPVEARVSRHPLLPDTSFESARNHTDISLHEGPLAELLDWCDVAYVTSGTATLETALREKPLVLVYKTSALTYWVVRLILKIPFIGLPNILTGREIVKECIQKNADPDRLADAMLPYLQSPDSYDEAVKDLRALKQHLGDLSPSSEVAKMVMEAMRQGADTR
jgi:lipid-A-disaccharide synthase